MKKIWIIALALIINLSVISSGCTDPPEPPGSEIPKLVIDYLGVSEGENQTAIYVHGMDEVRYDNISISINDEVVFNQRERFSIEYRTNLSSFSLEVDIQHEEDYYNYNASIDIIKGKKYVFKITYYDGEINKVKWNNLPYVEKLNLLKGGEK